MDAFRFLCNGLTGDLPVEKRASVLLFFPHSLNIFICSRKMCQMLGVQRARNELNQQHKNQMLTYKFRCLRLWRFFCLFFGCMYGCDLYAGDVLWTFACTYFGMYVFLRMCVCMCVGFWAWKLISVGRGQIPSEPVVFTFSPSPSGHRMNSSRFPFSIGWQSVSVR